MKVEVTGDDEFVGSSSSKREKSIQLAEKKRKGNRFACFSVGRRRAVDIEDSEFGVKKFESNR